VELPVLLPEEKLEVGFEMQYRSGGENARGDGTAKGLAIGPTLGGHQPKRASIFPRALVALITPQPSKSRPSFPFPSVDQKRAMPKNRRRPLIGGGAGSDC
jgi:hypothetical protein